MILMDSNRKHINFHKLFNNVRIIPCSKIQHAEENVKNLDQPKTVIIHVGVNDIGNGMDIYEVANRLARIARYAAQNYGCKVLISEITPLAQNLNAVAAANRTIQQALKELPDCIRAIPHPNLSVSSLSDDRHLIPNGPLNLPTAVEMLVDDIMYAVTGIRLNLRELKGTYRKVFRKGPSNNKY